MLSIRTQDQGVTGMPEGSSAAWPPDPVELYRDLHGRLMALAYAVAADSDPEDLVQETLVRVLTQHPEFSGIAYPLGYAKTVFFRVAAKRRTHRETPQPVQEWLETARPEAELRLEDSLDLQRALQELGAKQRIAVVLRFVYEFETREIADVLGVSQVTIRSQLMRGLRKLRVLLGGDELTALTKGDG